MVEHINSGDFKKEVVDSKTPVIIDFYADWCMPCKMMAPVFEKLSGQYKGKLKFVKINVDENQELASDFNIQGIPALVIAKKGQEVDRIVGYAPEEAIKEKIDSII
ncbi:thioredoxin [Candidatus Pacearchaeota archaeon]|nr:thioredoxin [Candidatus Pacearchaeota archaeon]